MSELRTVTVRPSARRRSGRTVRKVALTVGPGETAELDFNYALPKKNKKKNKSS